MEFRFIRGKTPTKWYKRLSLPKNRVIECGPHAPGGAPGMPGLPSAGR